MIIRKLERSDIALFAAQIRLFEKVFEMKDFQMPSQSYLQQLLTKPDFMAFVALKDKKVIGGLTGYVLHQYYAEKPLAYLFDLAVDTEFQRQGIGKSLVRDFCAYCQEAGFEEVFVQADQDEPQNLDFYRSTKPTGEEEVIHFTYVF